ncbi:MAG: hypothetical protein DCC67_07480 [Planctomycetota bacterium]|nr:MAG: hypothetical protein DCC67_07480 [Planctomycetota bacterium]
MGCGGVYDSTVSGVVSLGGAPLSSGAVAFIPDAGGPTAYAQIDSSGRYDVFTGKEPGLPSGSYTVTVVARKPPATERSKLGGPPPPGEALTPGWYGEQQSTPLKYTVEPGSNEINIELSTAPPPGWKPPGGGRR